MNIPEEAVEAAAIVLGTTKNGDPIITVRLDDLGDLVGTTPEYWMSQARAALEAAAPLMKAQVLSDAADKAFKDKSIQGLARVTIGNWLRMQADK